MNSITHALKLAGVPTPSNTVRVWQWLKDKGPHNSRAISVELQLPMTHVTSMVHAMTKRKQLKAIPQVSVRGEREPFKYEALGRVYEVLPLPKKIGKTQRPDIKEDGEFATLAVRVTKETHRAFEDHAKLFGVSVSDILRLSLELYAKKMEVTLPYVDPVAELRRKLGETK